MRKLIIFILLMAVVSCTTTRKVTEVVPEIHKEYSAREKSDTTLLHDSIYVHDSIFVCQKGDTIFSYNTKVQYRYKTQYRYINSTDTVIRNDSIPYPVKETEYVEVNKLKWYQKWLMYTGIFFIVLLLGQTGFSYAKTYFKR